jgi:hypothetical protein
VIVTGNRSGEPPDLEELKKVASVASPHQVPVLVGSGVNTGNIVEFSHYANGFIVGSCFKKDGKIHNAVEPGRVVELMRILKTITN